MLCDLCFGGNFGCVSSSQGQTAFDVADEDVLGYLEELQKKQNLVSLIVELVSAQNNFVCSFNGGCFLTEVCSRYKIVFPLELLSFAFCVPADERKERCQEISSD